MRIDIPDPVALNAQLERAWDGTDNWFAVLYFGTAEVTRWDVTVLRAEFEQQPGDYWSEEEREQREREWLSEYVARRVAPLFTGKEQQP